MAKAKKEEAKTTKTSTKTLACIPIYKGKFGQTAPERKEEQK